MEPHHPDPSTEAEVKRRGLVLERLASNLSDPTQMTRLFDELGLALFIVDSERNIVFWSRGAEQLTGYGREQVLGRFCLAGIRCERCLHQCTLFAKGKVEGAAMDIITQDGRTLLCIKNAVVLRDDQGTLVGGLEILQLQHEPSVDAPPSPSGLQGDDVREGTFAGMVGKSAPMERLFRLIKQVARTEATVLLTGESGTGKEMAAQAIHDLSPRRHGPFVALNCGALPDNLLESELFGHVKGAFTGALRDRAGLIEGAELGTLFLDEVGEMSPSAQVKLLRFLQERQYGRVGENRVRNADVRVVSATNQDLGALVDQGRFRSDLFYRLKVIPLELPPLRERPEDIPLLARHVLERLAKDHKKSGLWLAPATLQELTSHGWPGNVRELVNALEYAVAMAPGKKIRPSDLPRPLHRSRVARYRTERWNSLQQQDQQQAQLQQQEHEPERIVQALQRSGGNKSQAARALGMHRITLYRKLKKMGLDGPS